MKKSKSQKSYNLYALHLPILILAGVLLVGGYLSANKITQILNEEPSVLSKKIKTTGNDKGEKVNPGQAKKTETADKPGKSASGNAAIHRKNISDVVENLEAIAEEEEEIGNQDVSDEISDVAEEESEDVEDAADAIEEIEDRAKWKSVLLGSDYKNLGQLRSSLVHNRNRIKKLTKSMNKVEGEDNQIMLQEQLQVLNEETERIKAVIEEEEDQFSILGWVMKFFSGYDDTPLDDVDDVDDDVDESTESVGIDGTDPVEVEPVETEPVEEPTDL